MARLALKQLSKREKHWSVILIKNMEWRKFNITGIRGIQHEKCTSINFDQDRPDAYSIRHISACDDGCQTFSIYCKINSLSLTI